MRPSLRASSLLLPIIYLGFISLGLPDGTFGVAWPRMHRDLDVAIGLAGVLGVIGLLLSALSGFSSGRIIARFKTGPVVIASCVLTGSALMLISQAPSFPWVLLAIVPLGLGAGAVDAGLNGFVARHYSGRHMNWLHACWGIGATCGPFVMSQALASAGGWRSGFGVIASAQLSLAVLFLVTLRLWRTVPERVSSAHENAGAGARLPTTAANSVAGWLSAVIFAIYVAAEGTTGIWAGSILAVGRAFPVETAGLCATGFYAAITTGRILVGFVVDRFGNRRLIGVGCLLALAGAVLFTIAHSVPLAATSLILLGFGFSPVYPCLMHEVPRRFAPDAVQIVIGRQSGAANVGGALLPAAAGWLAQTSLNGVPWVIVGAVALLLGTIRKLDRLT